MKDDPKKLCGAKKTRCRMHGGATPKATNANRIHGLYSAALSPAEAAMWDDIPLDSLDEEIKMTRIWLARAGVLNCAVSLEPNAPGNLIGAYFG